MDRIAVIIPVSRFEKEKTVLISSKRLLSLDYTNLEVRIIYSLDIDPEGISGEKNDLRVEILKKEGVEVLTRKPRGKRAGAINDALDYISDFNPEFVAIFDVDSRPEENFIIECVKNLKEDPSAFIASSRRYISNPINLVTKTIEAEYYFINFLLKISAFKQFNGMIGVLRGDLILKHRLNEFAIAEDADFSTRMYSLGYNAILVKNTRIFEQAPISWSSLRNQRKRWYFGGLQLWGYWDLVKKSKNKRFLTSWISALSLTYIISILLPFMLLSPLMIFYSKLKRKNISFLVCLGLILHVLQLQYSALSALLNYKRNKEIEWVPMERTLE